MELLGFFIDLILLATLWRWGHSASDINEGVKAANAYG